MYMHVFVYVHLKCHYVDACVCHSPIEWEHVWKFLFISLSFTYFKIRTTFILLKQCQLKFMKTVTYMPEFEHKLRTKCSKFSHAREQWIKRFYYTVFQAMLMYKRFSLCLCDTFSVSLFKPSMNNHVRLTGTKGRRQISSTLILMEVDHLDRSGSFAI